ncbi:E3 ubiquitin-protein ligase BRE1B-like [Amphiura filiformis]|uniref:E3 ubiquitin-protein ligase BRE1B-like n=1 Tax=Amphiura filiformis TaxID=82378 RepID=UPI003B20F4A7
MANKRPASEMSASPTPGASSSRSGEKSGNGGEEGKDKEGPPNKKMYIEQMNLGAVSSQDEMDMKVLRFQNKKLVERLEMRNMVENELRTRIETQKQRQTIDELVLGFMNKYWTQLEEDLRVMLKRFEIPGDLPEYKVEVPPPEVKTEVKTEIKEEPREEKKPADGTAASEKESKEGSEPMEVNTTDGGEATKTEGSAPATTSTDGENKVGITVKEEPLADRSTPPGGDEGLSQDSIKSEPDADNKEIKEEVKEKESLSSFLNKLATSDQSEIDQAIEDRCSFSKEAVNRLQQSFENLQERYRKLVEGMEKNESIDEAVKSMNSHLKEENQRVQQLVTSLQDQHQKMTLQLTDQIDKLENANTKLAESSNMIDDMQYDLSQAHQRAYKLEILLEESYTKLKTATFCGGLNLGDGSKFGDKQLQSIFNELEEQKELATSRAAELEKLEEKHQETVSEMESLKLDLKRLPDHVVIETAGYINLKSQFSVLFKEAQEMKLQLEESRSLVQKTKNTHLRQIEQMETDELACQKKLRTEVIQLEDTLAQVRKEYEMLRIEFEQNLAANEQAGPINRELRHLVASFQSHNSQLKGEINRHRRKLKEATAEIAKLKTDLANANSHGSSSSYSNSSGSSSSGPGGSGSSSREPTHGPPGRRDDHHHHPDRRDRDKDKEKTKDERDRRDSGPKSDADLIKELKANLKKAQESQKEMKLLLDMYKGSAKEQRDKVQLMAAERRVRAEVEDLRQRLRHSEDRERSENRNLGDDDQRRKIRTLEEAVHQLQKKLGEKKQEEEALLSEMDVTGQAFEDMQEQNTRLLQQLREKDDANFKLMSERIKANQIHKLLREEKDVLGDQVATLQTQVDAQNQVVRKLEEKERVLQNNLSTVEKDLNCRQQALELHKRKAMETSQMSADCQCRLDRINGQIEELQRAVREKASAVEQENHKFRRAQEESQSLRRKIERYKRMELASTTDEVLMEEVRTYKEQLTCPCCKKGRKDVVLTKCFHVFCFDCIKTRYDTRQRKCPKCNHGFGANDYHRIWLD